jgi:hypothetical protein
MSLRSCSNYLYLVFAMSYSPTFFGSYYLFDFVPSLLLWVQLFILLIVLLFIFLVKSIYSFSFFKVVLHVF